MRRCFAWPASPVLLLLAAGCGLGVDIDGYAGGDEPVAASAAGAGGMASSAGGGGGSSAGKGGSVSTAPFGGGGAAGKAAGGGSGASGAGAGGVGGRGGQGGQPSVAGAAGQGGGAQGGAQQGGGKGGSVQGGAQQGGASQGGATQGGAGQGGSVQGGAQQGGAGQGGATQGGAGQGGTSQGGAGQGGAQQGGASQGGAGQGGAGQGGAGQGGATGAVCGNNQLEPGEQCEPFVPFVVSCSEVLGVPSQGFVLCSDSCTFDTSACSVCGNGVLDDGEECDQGVPATTTCATLLGPGAEGQLFCRTDCTIDSSICHICGNGSVEGAEDCDGAVPAGTTCASLLGPGSSGELKCSLSCTFNTSSCSVCGDGVRTGDEPCDGAALGGDGCGSVLGGNGQLGCNRCQFDTSACTVKLCPLDDGAELEAPWPQLARCSSRVNFFESAGPSTPSLQTIESGLPGRPGVCEQTAIRDGGIWAWQADSGGIVEPSGDTIAVKGANTPAFIETQHAVFTGLKPLTGQAVAHVINVETGILPGSDVALGPGVPTSPLLAKGRIYVGDSSGRVYSLSFSNFTGLKINDSANIGAPIMVPLAYGRRENLIYAVSSGTDAGLVGLDAGSLTVKWQQPSPVPDAIGLLIAQDGRLVVTSPTQLHVVRVSGSVESYAPGYSLLPAALAADGAYVLASTSGEVLVLEPDLTQRWLVKPAATQLSRPIVDANGDVYVCSGDRVVKLEGPTGELIWERTLPTATTKCGLSFGETGLWVMADTASYRIGN